MSKNGMRPIHPGEVLREEFAKPLGLSANAIARALRVPPNRVTALLNEERTVTADTALRFARYFGTTPEFWMNLQATFDLRTAEIESAKVIAADVKPLPRKAAVG
jgi:addiction module HigA family antidote